MNTTGNGTVIHKNSNHFFKVVELDNFFFPIPWDKVHWVDLDEESHLLFGWVKNDELLAFSLFGASNFDETAHLLKILVHPDHQGKVVSRHFWQFIMTQLAGSHFQSIYLEVQSHNHRAISFYSKVGFSHLREIKNYYSDGSAAQTMQLML